MISDGVSEERFLEDDSNRRMMDISENDLMVEIEYESKEEAIGRVRVMAALLSVVQPSLTQDSGERSQTHAPLRFGQAQLFPTAKRPIRREIVNEQSASIDVVNEWFSRSDINVFSGLSTSQS